MGSVPPRGTVTSVLAAKSYKLGVNAKSDDFRVDGTIRGLCLTAPGCRGGIFPKISEYPGWIGVILYTWTR